MVSAEHPALSLVTGQTTARRRLQSVDALRGAVMILMALDHVRDFVSSAAMQFPPTDLTRTTAALFFTRWITHCCAPTFAFTAGIGAFLWMRRDRTPGQLSRFLVTRGVWLIFLELTVLRWILLFQFGWTNQLIILSVIWMLGLSMVVLAALIHLPARWLAGLSLVLIAVHNLFDKVDPVRFGRAAWLWDILHVQAVFGFLGANILVAYPLVPWVAVMAAGYCFGPVLRWEPARRQSFMIRLGLGLSVAFVVVRALNRYGDPTQWAAQHSTLYTVLSFLNCTKYPPSLDFLLMTLGPAMLWLAWFDSLEWRPANPLIVFGRVPLFYFVVHFFAAHAIASVMEAIRYGRPALMFGPLPNMGGPRNAFPADFGFDLWVVYLLWAALVVAMYPLCRRFASVKARRTDWWLSYL